MKRSVRTTVTLGLVCAMALVACGSDEDASSDTPSTGGEGDPTEETQPTGTGNSGEGVASTQECSDEDPVLIGGVFNLSGPTADSGQFGRDGLELASSVINETGGILGRCVETIIKDDGNDPTKGAQAGSELIEREGVDLIVGPIVSPSAGPILEISTEAKVPMALNALLPLDYAEFPYAFRTNLDVNQVAESFTRYASNSGLERLAVLAVNNVFGTAQIDAINEYAPTSGLEVVATELFNSGDADLTPVMRKLQDADPDAIVLVGFGGDAVAALTARETLGMLEVPVLGFSAISLPFIAESVGEDGMQGVYVSMQFRRMMREAGAEDITDERAIEFREAYANFRGEDVLTASPTQTSSAYDAAMLLASAANGAGSLDADEIQQYLYANGYEGVQADYTFSEGDHDGVDLADNVLVLANSLSNGSMEIAPGQ